MTKTHLNRTVLGAIILGAGIGLSGCTDPGRFEEAVQTPNSNTREGAFLGAAAGALLGAITSDDGDRADGALKGALLGGAVGAGVGYSLDRQEAELRAALANDRVQIINAGDRLIVTLPQDILFDTDSFAVRGLLREDLAAVANSLQRYPSSTVQIIGHTDADGDAVYNQRLSERRANAVADVLSENGVPFSRLQTFGQGEAQPVASNLTVDGKARNRRVEIVILPTT